MMLKKCRGRVRELKHFAPTQTDTNQSWTQSGLSSLRTLARYTNRDRDTTSLKSNYLWDLWMMVVVVSPGLLQLPQLTDSQLAQTPRESRVGCHSVESQGSTFLLKMKKVSHNTGPDTDLQKMI